MKQKFIIYQGKALAVCPCCDKPVEQYQSHSTENENTIYHYSCYKEMKSEVNG